MTETDNYICVIGSSAGGVSALKKLFTSFSSFPNNIAFIVAQHLSPGTESHLAHILSSGISAPVVTATSYDAIHPGKIYISPPDKNITALNGKIILKPANTLYKPSIDNLFISAAAAYGKNLIGVILTGSGKDGAKGMAEIKKQGGYTIVQEPADAEYESMPLEAIRTHSVDAIVECRQIPGLVLAYAGNKNLHKVLKEGDKNKTPLKQIFNLLLRYSGTDFNGYKPTAIERRMKLRMSQVHCATLDEYLAYIDKNPQETGMLYQHLLIGVTAFFRDREAFSLMQKKLAELLAEKKSSSHIRLWSAACSTGEEAYTLAMILCEILGEKINSHNIKVYASDIDEAALAFARKGIYSAEQVKNVPADLLDRYFTKQGHSYVVTKQLRQLVVFHKHDITSDPPFVQVELICCRNMLIYFNQQSQNRILSFFNYALKDGGILFLGKSETISRHKDIFSAISVKYCLFKKIATGNSKYPLLRSKTATAVEQTAPEAEGTLTDMLKDGFYKAYPHAFAVINEKNDIQHIHGDIPRFIHLPQGDVNLNILKIVRPELQIELRALLYKCLNENKAVYGHAKHVLLDKEKVYLRIAVWPLTNAEGHAKFFVVAFEVPDLSEFLHLLGAGKQATGKNVRNIRLEKELQQTKEQLQAFIDQLEAANGQLQLLNEELHSTNEELQVANEELEANNEEQQEANEQITDSYGQLKQLHKQLEEKESALRLTTNTFQTVLDNARECYMLVGRNYTLLAFNNEANVFFNKFNKTPLVNGQSMFNFLPLDFITQFKIRFDKAWDGQASSFEVKHTIDNEDLWMDLRYAPVYGPANAIESVLLSFMDITAQVIAQRKVDDSELLFRSMIENSTDLIFRKDAERKILYVSPSIQRIAGYRPEQVLSHNLVEFLYEADIPAVATLHKTVLQSPANPITLEFRLKHADGRVLWMEGTAVNMLDVQGVASIIANIRDVTIRKLADQKLLSSEIRFRSLIENSHDGIALLGPEGKLVYLSNASTHIMGYGPDELLGVDPSTFSHPDDVAPMMELIGNLANRFGDTATAQYRMKHKNGEWRWIKANITNQLHQEHINAFVFNYEDVTERKAAEERLMQSERIMAEAQKLGHFGSWELDIKADGYGQLRWSDEVFRIYGYAPHSIEVSLEKAAAPTHPDDKPVIDKFFKKAFAERSAYFFDHRIMRPDGSTRWVHVDGQFITDEATGELLKIAGTIQDITDRKEAESKLLKYEADVKAIFDNTEIGYVLFDNSYNVVAFNPQAAKFIQAIYNKQLSGGTPFSDYLENDADARKMMLLFKKVLCGRDVKFDLKHDWQGQGANITWYALRMNPIKSGKNEMHGICLSIADITYRKQHEIEMEKITTDLIQRNKDLEQFTYVVSHNLRAPLTNIMGLTQLLLDENETENFRQVYTKQLSVSAQKMDVIIKDLNRILQIKKDVSEVKQTIFFSQLVDDIKLSIQYTIIQENITIITDFTATDEFVTVKSYLYSIFYNLIINSIKYRQPGVATVIEIKSIVTKNALELVFKDNGLGFDLARKGNEVFGLFKRFHHHIEGKGMGLFMVKTQVETLGGAISVESEVNKGTTFRISFPFG